MTLLSLEGFLWQKQVLHFAHDLFILWTGFKLRNEKILEISKVCRLFLDNINTNYFIATISVHFHDNYYRHFFNDFCIKFQNIPFSMITRFLIIFTSYHMHFYYFVLFSIFRFLKIIAMIYFLSISIMPSTEIILSDLRICCFWKQIFIQFQSTHFLLIEFECNRNKERSFIQELGYND